jgi:hypothetical protein
METPAPDVVRSEVRKLLESTPAYAKLAPGDRTRVANDLVRVASYLSNRDWLEPSPAGALAEQQQPPPPIDQLKRRLAGPPGSANKDFQANAVKQGVEQFGELVKKVDFPQFVSGLVQGVFSAIVDASIRQMEAYAELLAATAKTVDQFARDHITDAQARDFAINRFPTKLALVPSEDGGRKLAMADDADDTGELGQFANVKQVDLDSEEGEVAFVTAAKQEMARGRMQSMALMVLLGINRIVVTNGRINAKVVFDMKASDVAARSAQAELHDRARSESAAAGGFHMPWGGGGGYTKNQHTTTVESSVDDTSESKAAVKAQLAGDVRVNFKSETFPLERLLDAGGLDALTNMARPGRGVPPPEVAAPAAPAAPKAAL